MDYILYYFGLCGLCCIVFPKKTLVYRYCWNALIGLDNAVNACVFFGDPDETISSHAYKGSLKGHKGWTLLNNILEKIDPGHGKRVVEWDEGTSSGLSALFTKDK